MICNESAKLHEVIGNLESASCYLPVPAFIINQDFKVVFSSEVCKKHTGLNSGIIFDEQITDLNVIFKFNPKPVIDCCTNLFNDNLARTIILPTYYNKDLLVVSSFHLIPIIINHDTEAVIITIHRYDPVNSLYEYLQKNYLHKLLNGEKSSYNAILPFHDNDKGVHKYQIVLSELEECIVYLVLKGFSNVEIAKIMSCVENKQFTKYYINKIIDQKLKAKFNASNKVHLIDILYRNGYSKLIPRKLIENYHHETIYLV